MNFIHTEIGNGVGRVRQRYPIFPIHGAASPAFKEEKALQAIILDDDYDDPVTNPDGFFGDDRDKIYGFEMNLQGGGHQHVIYIPGWRVRNNWFDDDIPLTTSDDYITAESDTRNGHAHTVEVWREKDSITDEWIYHVKRCRPGSISDEYVFNEDGACCEEHPDWLDDVCSDLHNAVSRE